MKSELDLDSSSLGRSLFFTPSTSQTELIGISEFAIVLVPPALAAVLAILAKKLVEQAADVFFRWLFGHGDQSVSLTDIRRLMDEFCQYVCTFVYRTVDEARIRAKLDAAGEKLEVIANQLSLAAGSKHPTPFYEALLVNGLFANVLAAYKGLSQEAAEVAQINYAIAATAELKVMAELIRRGSSLVDVSLLRQRVLQHSTYLQNSADNLDGSVRLAIRVGAHSLNNYFPEDMISNPATSSAEDPHGPEKQDYEAMERNRRFPSGSSFPMRYWMQRPDPYSPVGFQVIESISVEHRLFPQNPPLNQQIRGIIAQFRVKQSALTTHNLTDLHETTLKPLAELIKAWPEIEHNK